MKSVYLPIESEEDFDEWLIGYNWEGYTVWEAEIIINEWIEKHQCKSSPYLEELVQFFKREGYLKESVKELLSEYRTLESFSWICDPYLDTIVEYFSGKGESVVFLFGETDTFYRLTIGEMNTLQKIDFEGECIEL